MAQQGEGWFFGGGRKFGGGWSTRGSGGCCDFCSLWGNSDFLISILTL